jgi:hypothetical protein
MAIDRETEILGEDPTQYHSIHQKSKMMTCDRTLEADVRKD